MVQGNKLRTYRLFKNNIGLEKYLLLNNCKTLNELTKFRISAHELEIEKGRHKGIPPDKRFCKLCNNDIVEDEIHFLLQCPSLKTERSSFISDLSSKFTNFKTLNDQSKFVWLMSNEDPFVNNIMIKLIDSLIKSRRVKLSINT